MYLEHSQTSIMKFFGNIVNNGFLLLTILGKATSKTGFLMRIGAEFWVLIEKSILRDFVTLISQVTFYKMHCQK